MVDAAFLRRSERARLATLAHSLAVPFAILECRAPMPVLRARLMQRQARGSDASEADVEGLERLQTVDETPDASELAVAIAESERREA